MEKPDCFVVGIKDKTGKIVGTGFVIDDNRVVTCAHVLYFGVFDEREPARGEQVTIMFSRLEPDYIASVENFQFNNDIAILITNLPLPPEVTPAILCSYDDLEKKDRTYFSTKGYRPFGEQYQAPPADGHVIGPIDTIKKNPPTHPPLVLETKRIEGGMSGAPVYIPAVDRVIGFVSDKWETEPDTALAMSAEVIPTACPEIQLYPPYADSGRTSDFVDRREEVKLFDQFLVRQRIEQILAFLVESGQGKTRLMDHLYQRCQAKETLSALVQFKYADNISGPSDFLFELCDHLDWGQFPQTERLLQQFQNTAPYHAPQESYHQTSYPNQPQPMPTASPQNPHHHWMRQLGQTFQRELRQLCQQQQVVLFFDTYEQSTKETRLWVDNWLFNRLRDLPKLLIVVAGRQTLLSYFQDSHWQHKVCLRKQFNPLERADIVQYIRAWRLPVKAMVFVWAISHSCMLTRVVKRVRIHHLKI
ncbi:serine protease [Anaerolineales bacterium HSG24]|nr:serine protease [Anaerolineales bacterium HSG24]